MVSPDREACSSCLTLGVTKDFFLCPHDHFIELILEFYHGAHRVSLRARKFDMSQGETLRDDKCASNLRYPQSAFMVHLTKAWSRHATAGGAFSHGKC